MANPLISVIMPAHNADRFIGEAIDSVLKQTYPYWELIIIDDDSTDKTAELIQRYPDQRIRYSKQARLGSPAKVRNVGLKMAQGQYIAFMDADDAYFENALETLVTILEAHPEKTAVYGFAWTMTETGTPLPEHHLLQEKPDGTLALPDEYRHTWGRILTGHFSCLLPGLMIRKSTRERVGLFNEALFGPEDYEFYVRLFIDNLENVACIPQYIYRYRHYGDSITKSPTHYQRILQSCITLMDGFYARTDLPKTFYQFESRAYLFCHRYLARERILNQQPQLARNILKAAWQHPKVKAWHWIQECLPLWIRASLPFHVDQALVTGKAKLRRAYYGLKFRVFRPIAG